MNKKVIAAVVLATLTLPLAAMAFSAGNTPNSNPTLSLEGIIQIIFNILWIVAVAFFIIMFVLAAFQFFAAQGDPDAVHKARLFVLWGIVGVAVALLAFSIPFIVRNTLDSSGAGIGPRTVASIGNELVSSPTATSITVTWTTTNPETSRVIYDTESRLVPTTSPNYGYANSTTEDSTMSTSHSVTITGLTNGTTYYLRAVSHGSPETVGSELTTVADGAGVTSGPGGGGVTNNTLQGYISLYARNYDIASQNIEFSFNINGPQPRNAMFTVPSTSYFNGVGSGGLPYTDLVPGTYSITKNSPLGWTTTDAFCIGAGVTTGTYSSATNSITDIVVNPGASITCYFIGHIGSGDLCPPVIDPCMSDFNACLVSIQNECQISTTSTITTWCQASTLPLDGPNFSGVLSSTPPNSCLSTLVSCSAQYTQCRNVVPTVCTPSQLATAYQNFCAAY